MAAQGSGATNPFTAGTPSHPKSPASAASAMPVPQMLEVTGNMMNAVRAQSSSLKEAVENFNNRTSSGPSLSKLLQRPENFLAKRSRGRAHSMVRVGMDFQAVDAGSEPGDPRKPGRDREGLVLSVH